MSAKVATIKSLGRGVVVDHEWSHNGAMPNIQVKNVPPEIHAILRDRASENHQSLQEFILETLVKSAEMPTDKEIFERLRADMDAAREDRPPISRQMILDAIEDGRAGR